MAQTRSTRSIGCTVGLRDRAVAALCSRHGILPCRTAADHRTSIRRLVGLPTARLVRTDRTVWAAGWFAALCGRAALRQYRRHSRLGAGAFSDRPARLGAV